MIKVGIDLTALRQRRTGVDNYLTGLVRALADHDGEMSYTLFINAEDAASFRGLPPNFAVRRTSLRQRPVRLGFQQALLPALARNLDVVHSPTFIAPLLRGRQRHLLTVHDMTSFSHPHLHNRLHSSAAYRSAVAASIRRVDRVSVPSDSVASEVTRWLPGLPESRVAVHRPGIGPQFRPHSPSELAPVLARLRIDGPYVLFVGTLEPRKNLLTLIEAYGRLLVERPDAPLLVLAGQMGWGDTMLKTALARAELRDRVRLLGYVDDRDLPAVYAGATLFVFPSHAEGFGFPPLEAMASGTPVVASDTTSLRDNLAGAAELVPPTDVDALRAALARLLAGESLRSSLAARGRERASTFRWARMAREIADVYAELAPARR